MKELVQYLARSLVNNPDAVEVKETQGETASILELKVAKEDLGRIIGKQGRTAKSIRTILNAAASRANHSVHVSSKNLDGHDAPCSPASLQDGFTGRLRPLSWPISSNAAMIKP